MEKLNLFSIKLYSYYYAKLYRHANLILFCLGIFIITYGISDFVNAQPSTNGVGGGGSGSGGSGEASKIIKEQLCKILGLLQGTFGALILIVAGLAAVVTAAMGAYKLAMACVVIACGAFVIESFQILFFPDAHCEKVFA
jgi:hypothetical protein